MAETSADTFTIGVKPNLTSGVPEKKPPISPKECRSEVTTSYIPPDIIRRKDDPYNPYKFPGIIFQREYTATQGEYPVHTIHVQPCKAIVATDGVRLQNGHVNSVLVHEEVEAERLESGLGAIVSTFPTTKPEKYLVFSATNTVSDRRSSDVREWKDIPLGDWLKEHGIIDGENATVIVDNYWVERLQWTVKPDGNVVIKLNKQYIDIPEKKLPPPLKQELQQTRMRIQKYNQMGRTRELGSMKSDDRVNLKMAGKNIAVSLKEAQAILEEADSVQAPFAFVSPTQQQSLELYGDLKPGEIAEKEYTRNAKGERYQLGTSHVRECKAIVMTENKPAQAESADSRENMLGHLLLQAQYLRDAITTMQSAYEGSPKYLFLTSLPSTYIENRKTPSKAALVSIEEFFKIAHPEINSGNSMIIVNPLIEYLSIRVNPNGYVHVEIDKNRTDPSGPFLEEDVQRHLRDIQTKLDKFNGMGVGDSK